ncbi:hypothetical protein RHSIM_Rhsim01G0013400 [Rhododendron simsii]|uniref:F-box domain-containing protein n=1 Tax=Rhododendron simsii TaxID=118357 RepID=A0A834HIN0_RHOSS|nr:hypothetical protein RHSIM_Rhsim01G0013400 [Rhododendron simsii]
MNKQARRKEAAIIKGAPSGISAAAELVANNVDLLSEILLWLPMKSIFRFKCLCKHWLSLLSDSQFATNHSTRNPRPSSISGLDYYIKQTLRSVSLHRCGRNLPSLSFLKDSKAQSTVFVGDSCNGLLLCYYYGPARGIDSKLQFIVCNPTTKKYALLPKLDGFVNVSKGYLAFDPSKSPHHYKVVLVSYRPDPYQINVYSSQSLCWRKVSPDQKCVGFGRGVFWNGAIHWLTDDHFLKRFDVDVEEIIAMPNPKSPKILSQYRNMYFGECGGGLILIQSPLHCPIEFRILELEKDYSGWVVKCQVNLMPLISEFPEMESRSCKNYSYRVLYAGEGENGSGFALLLAIPRRIVSYNLQYETWDVLLVAVKSDPPCITSDNFLKRFVVDAEDIIAMPNPQSPKILRQRNIMYFGECGGGLILVLSRSWCPSGFRILELKRDYSGWVVKCRINLRPLIFEFVLIIDDASSISYLNPFFPSLYPVLGRMTRKASNKRRKAVLKLTPSEISPAAELIANNVDLLTEILVRLPAKSAIRFKCVSKQWLSLVSESQFSINHSARNPRPSSTSGLYVYIEGTQTFVSLQGPRHNLPSISFLDGLRERSTIKVAHSCNGLLLCYINSIEDGYFQQFIVCNPTTKKYTLLPKPDGLVNGWSGCLVFDPSKSPRHYKVVIVGFSPGPCGPYQIDVYSSKSLCWEKKFSTRQNLFGHGVFWNGAIHWLTGDYFLVRFDGDGEEIIAMPNPRSPKNLFEHNIMYFGECGGGLILIQYRLYCSDRLRILELKRDHSGWVVKCRVNLGPLIAAFPEMETRRNYYSHGFKVLCAVKGENERGFVLLLAIPGRIVSYNLKKKTWDVLRDLLPGASKAFCLDSYTVPFSETLFPV